MERENKIICNYLGLEMDCFLQFTFHHQKAAEFNNHHNRIEPRFQPAQLHTNDTHSIA